MFGFGSFFLFHYSVCVSGGGVIPFLVGPLAGRSDPSGGRSVGRRGWQRSKQQATSIHLPAASKQERASNMSIKRRGPGPRALFLNGLKPFRLPLSPLVVGPAAVAPPVGGGLVYSSSSMGAHMCVCFVWLGRRRLPLVSDLFPFRVFVLSAAAHGRGRGQTGGRRRRAEAGEGQMHAVPYVCAGMSECSSFFAPSSFCIARGFPDRARPSFTTGRGRRRRAGVKHEQ